MVAVRTSNQCPQPSRLCWLTFTESLKASAAHPAGAASHRASLHPDLWEQTRRWDAAAGWRSLLPVSAWAVAGWPFCGPEVHHLSYVTKILIRQEVSLWQQLLRICWFWDETSTRVRPRKRVVSSVGGLKLICFLFLKFCCCEQTLVLRPANDARALDGGPASIW